MPSINHSVPHSNNNIRTQLEARQQTSKKYFDRNTQDKSDLSENQPVRVRNQETKRWEPAHVVKQAGTPRSYVVQRVAGGVPLRRNRQQIRPTSEQWRVGDPAEQDELDLIDFNCDSLPEGARKMVGSEPSVSTFTSSHSTREMVGSEPSLRAANALSNISPQNLTNDVSSSTAASSSSGSRYPPRQRKSPDFYQAGK